MWVSARPSLLFVGVALALVNCVWCQSNDATSSSSNATVSSIISLLRSNDLKKFADLLESNSSHFARHIRMSNNAPLNQTLLAPIDSAFDTLGNAPSGDALSDLIAYHILNSTITANQIPRKGYNAEIVPTMFSAIKTPFERAQVVVLAKDGSRVYVKETLQNITVDFDKQIDPVGGMFHIHPISAFLTIPESPGITAKELNTPSTIAMLTATGLAEPINNASAVTIFAPTEEAVSAFMVQMAVNTPEQTINLIHQHYLNGTVIFSTQFPAADDSNANAIRQVYTSAGELLTIRNDKGQLRVQMGDVIANVVQEDILLNNGVGYRVDRLFGGTTFNQTAADAAYEAGLLDSETNPAAPGSALAGYGIRQLSGGTSANHAIPISAVVPTFAYALLCSLLTLVSLFLVL